MQQGVRQVVYDEILISHNKDGRKLLAMANAHRMLRAWISHEAKRFFYSGSLSVTRIFYHEVAAHTVTRMSKSVNMVVVHELM